MATLATHPGVGYAELRAAAATAEAAAAVAEAAAAAARTATDQAARAMQAHPVHALADSTFALLDGRGSLHLVTNAVHNDDTLCLALTCRALRDALWARFPQVPCDRNAMRALCEGLSSCAGHGRLRPRSFTSEIKKLSKIAGRIIATGYGIRFSIPYRQDLLNLAAIEIYSYATVRTSHVKDALVLFKMLPRVHASSCARKRRSSSATSARRS
jgi:hypothetical protein